MKASIIVVLFNGEFYIQNCLESLRLQTSSDFEIIIIDNGSSDSGAALAAAHFPAVRLVRNSRNIGFAAACNQGAALARGEVLAFLNQDTRVQPGWLEELLTPLVRDPMVGLTTSKLLYMVQHERINLCGLDVHYSGLSFGRGALQPATQMTNEAYVGAVSGAAFAIPKAVWEKLGGFDDDYFMYYEDTDLSWRAWLAGYASLYVPASVALHDAALKPANNALEFCARNRLVLLLKTWQFSTFVLLAPGLLLAELVDWVLMAAYGKAGLRAKVRALGWVWANRQAIRDRRQRALRARLKPDGYLLRQCSPVFKPAVMDGGVVGRALVGAANILLRLNYQLAISVMRKD